MIWKNVVKHNTYLQFLFGILGKIKKDSSLHTLQEKEKWGRKGRNRNGNSGTYTKDTCIYKKKINASYI